MENLLFYVQVALTLLMFFPIGVLFFKYFKVFVLYMFDSPIYWWDKYIEKPRLLFFILGLCLSICSWLIFRISDFGWPLIPKTLAILLNTISLAALSWIWSKNFKNNLIPMIRRKIVHEKIESPFKRGYDLSAALDQLISQKYIDTDTESFINFLNLMHYQQKKK